MNKKYICRLSATNILVKVNGVVKRLEFEPAVITSFGLRGCAYKTDDNSIQYAIEHHPQYRNGRLDCITLYGESYDKVQEPVVEKAVEEPVVEKKVARKGKAKKGE